MKPDNRLRSIIREHLPHIGQWVSIETGTTESGVADLNCMVRRQSREVWIECKATHGYQVRFKPSQPGWLFTRWRYGGNAFIFTRRTDDVKKRSYDATLDELYVTSAEFVRELSSGGLLSVNHLLVCRGGPSEWQWVQVEHILRHFTSSSSGRSIVTPAS
jgi:hypothetical protein